MNSESLLTQYRRHGVVFPLSALFELEVLQAQRQYLDLCDPGKLVAEGDRRIFGHLLHSWVAQLVSHPAILEAVRRLIGPNILVWVSEFNAKAPHTSNFFSWHQDLYYWRHKYGDLRTIPMVEARAVPSGGRGDRTCFIGEAGDGLAISSGRAGGNRRNCGAAFDASSIIEALSKAGHRNPPGMR